MKTQFLSLAFASMALAVSAQDVIVLEDFDSNRNVSYFNPINQFMVSSDEAPGTPTDMVGFFDLTLDVIDAEANFLTSGVDNIMGMTGTFQGYNIDEYPFYSIDLYSNDPFNFALKVEDVAVSPKNTLSEKFVDYTTTGEWQTFLFDFSEAVNQGTKYEVVFLLDIFNSVTPKALYFDNFTAYKVEPLGLENKVLKNTLVTFPNPALNTLNISSENITGTIENVRVLDLIGNEMITIAGEATQVDVSALSAGMYTLVIETSLNSSTATFVKQ